MKKEIVYTDKYLLVVDNLSRPAKEGETFLSKEGFIHTNTGYNYGDKLIIAHLPLSDAPILGGVPLLPPLSQGDNVEELAESTFGTDIDSIRGSQEYDLNKDLKTGFVRGYNKAKEKYKYTEEDMFGFAQWIIDQDRKMVLIYSKKSLLNEYIQSLQQPSRPTHFECEVDNILSFNWDDGIDAIVNDNFGNPKTTTNSQGQEELVGKYLNL